MMQRPESARGTSCLLCCVALFSGCGGGLLDSAQGDPRRDGGDGQADSEDARTGIPRGASDAAPSAGDDGSTSTSDAGPLRECQLQPELMWEGQGSYPQGTSFDSPFDCGSAGTLLEHSGPPENRVNLLVLGDGYRQTELAGAYSEHVGRLVQQLFSKEGEPYLQYRKYINVCRMDVASAESGTDIPDENVQVETAFDGHGSDRTRLGIVDARKVNAALDRLLTGTRLDPDWIAVSLNVKRWFNSGGSIMVWAGGNPGKPDVALHEAGHSFHALADEYGGSSGMGYTGAEPRELNVTANPSGERWKLWLDYEQPGVGRIGAFEGGRYYDRGIYRPSQNSKMNIVPALHNAPCMEKVVQDIYRLVRPVDAWTKNDAPLMNPCALELRLVDPARLKVAWTVNGKEVTSAEPSRFEAAAQLSAPGEYTVGARVYDDTPLVRGDRAALEQTITWSVLVP